MDEKLKTVLPVRPKTLYYYSKKEREENEKRGNCAFYVICVRRKRKKMENDGNGKAFCVTSKCKK